MKEVLWILYNTQNISIWTTLDGIASKRCHMKGKTKKMERSWNYEPDGQKAKNHEELAHKSEIAE